MVKVHFKFKFSNVFEDINKSPLAAAGCVVRVSGEITDNQFIIEDLGYSASVEFY
jgi:hypothetical protein